MEQGKNKCIFSAAGVAIGKLLYGHGITDVVMCDTAGIIYEGRPTNMNQFKNDLAAFTNRTKIQGTLADAVKGRDLFVGVSSAVEFIEILGSLNLRYG